MPATLPTRAKAPRDLGDSADIAGVRAVGKETRTATPEPQSIPRSSAPSIEAPLGDAMAPASPTEIHLARSMTQLGLAHMQILQTTLLDAYQHAVATMDAPAVRELASQVVHGLLQVEEARDQIGPGEELAPFRSQLDTAWRTAVSHLTVQMSPQVLGGTPVAESVVPPPPAQVVHVGVELVAREASCVLELLEAAARIAAYVMPEGAETSQPAQPNDALLAVAELQRFASRPIDALFLVALLRRTGAWLELAHARGSDGRTAAEVLGATEIQANETGGTVELGPEWNAKTAADALSYGFADWAVTDADGLRVVEMLQAAPPPGRAALIKQLHRMGLLERLAANVGWLPFQQIAETLNDPDAEALIAPYWRGKGGTPSSHQLLMQQVDRNLDEGGALNTLQAGLWYLLDAGLDQFSFGAKPAIDRAHEARDAGLISEDGFWAEADKAMAKAALVAAAAAATGGLAGSWAEGAAFGLGAGEGGAAILGGAFGGAVGNVSAHLSGDLYDQLLNDKQGFDGFASYAQDFAAGGITGAIMAPIGLHAAKHLPASARSLAQAYAARHPHLISILESARAAGVGSAFRIRTTVREWLEVLRTGAGGPGTMGGLAGPQLAFVTSSSSSGHAASAPDLAALPPDVQLWVTARPIIDLDAPMARLDENAPWLEVESVEVRGSGRRNESLFDNYGDEATYADDASDYRHQEDQASAPADNEGFARDPSVRHVRTQSISPELANERGVSILSNSRLGIGRPPRHHLLPQEHIGFFQERGFPGRNIDDFCIEVTQLEHDLLHGGNQSLARRYWKDGEWNTALMEQLRSDESRLQARRGPAARLSRSMILDTVEQMRKDFNISDRSMVRYDATDTATAEVTYE